MPLLPSDKVLFKVAVARHSFWFKDAEAGLFALEFPERHCLEPRKKNEWDSLRGKGGERKR